MVQAQRDSQHMDHMEEEEEAEPCIHVVPTREAGEDEKEMDLYSHCVYNLRLSLSAYFDQKHRPHQQLRFLQDKLGFQLQ